MTEQIPPTPPSTDGAPATEVPMVAGAGQTFDDLDSSTPLSVDGDADSTDAGSAGDDSGDPGDDSRG